MDNPNQDHTHQPPIFAGHGNRIMMDQIDNKIRPPQEKDNIPCSICNLKYGSTGRNHIPGVT